MSKIQHTSFTREDFFAIWHVDSFRACLCCSASSIHHRTNRQRVMAMAIGWEAGRPSRAFLLIPTMISTNHHHQPTARFPPTILLQQALPKHRNVSRRWISQAIIPVGQHQSVRVIWCDSWCIICKSRKYECTNHSYTISNLPPSLKRQSTSGNPRFWIPILPSYRPSRPWTSRLLWTLLLSRLPRRTWQAWIDGGDFEWWAE